MTRTALLCSSALILCVASSALAAERARPATYFNGNVHRVIAAVPGAVTLYDQNSDDSGVAVLSTNFTDFDDFDSYGADDFIVPSGHKWKIQQVEVAGNYSASDGNKGPARSESVFFYRDDHGLPGELIVKCDQIQGKDNQGSFAIRLPKSCKAVLKGGNRYWISVFANMDIACCGQWNWGTRNGENNKAAAWESPGGHLGPCTIWGRMTSCVGNNGEGPDFMFTLKGKDVIQ
jgi:hypothetical protein